tara:strand:- start:1081 stop:1254 length:174 start_codon:yes stop_codon:yes gene_type:complete
MLEAYKLKPTQIKMITIYNGSKNMIKLSYKSLYSDDLVLLKKFCNSGFKNKAYPEDF